MFNNLRQLDIPIEEMQKLCRSCLGELHNNDYFWIDGFYQEKKVSEIYRFVSSVEINTGDNLPKKLCSTCYNSLIKFNLFKTKVLQSEEILTKVATGVATYKPEENLDYIYKNEENEDLFRSGDCYDVSNDLHNDEYVNWSDSDSEDERPLLSRLKISLENVKNEIPEENLNYDTVNQHTIDELPIKEENKEVKTSANKRIKKSQSNKKKRPGGRRKISCEVCKKIISAYKVDNHMRTHTKEKPFSCEQCGVCFAEKSNLTRHLKTHGEERPFKCDLCSKGFLRPSSLQMHMDTVHNPERKVICSVCGKGFKHHCFLNKHMLNVHNKSKSGDKTDQDRLKEKGFTCPVCGNIYLTKSSLNVHKMKHSLPKAFLCTTCGNSFSTKQTLESHQQIHTGEKKYVCKICHKRFGYITTLKQHILVHTGAKPLSCHLCSKQFRQHSHLRTHIKSSHSVERPYKCTYCNKSFKLNSNLTVHLRIHTGQKPHVCDVCHKGFYDTSSMKKHRKIHGDKSTEVVNWVTESEIVPNVVNL